MVSAVMVLVALRHKLLGLLGLWVEVLILVVESLLGDLLVVRCLAEGIQR